MNTMHLRSMAAQIPLVEDRLLLELVNDLTVADDLVTHRCAQGTFARLAATITGRDRQAQALTSRALVDSQHALMQWLSEVSQRGAITSLALGRAAQHLKETNRTVARLGEHADRTASQLAQLAKLTSELEEACESRISALERQLATLDLRQQASETFDRAVDRWRAEHSYSGLPWEYQVALLAREVAAGPSGLLEHVTGDRGYRDHLVDRILTDPRIRAVNTRPFALTFLLDRSWHELPGSDQRSMLAELLDVGLEPRLALPPYPLTAFMAATMELAALASGARPERPAVTALELVRRRVGELDGTTDVHRLVRRLVAEQADGTLQIRSRMEMRSGG